MRSVLLLAVASCATSDPCASDDASDCDAVSWSDGKSDASGVPAVFDRNNIMSNAVMTTAAVDANAVQQFLEQSPYGRSWLADLQIDNVPFSTRVVDIGNQYGIDPIVLLARMQVESSLVSALHTPSNSRVNAALGCACPDGSTTCGDSGLINQLDCAGQVLQQHIADSQNGVRGEWRAGVTMTTSDHYSVTPIDDATAALYAYTPWVLPNTGGNWLVWNVTRKFLKGFDGAGTLHLP